MVGKLLSILVSTAILSLISCAPVKITNRTRGDSIFGNVSSEKLITFMQTFGYLQEPTAEIEGLKAEFLYAEDAVVQGIRNIQKFGALDETGVLDEKTVELLSAPRCGVKDVTNERERRKRYIIGSKNWEKRQITYFIANWSPKVEEAKMVTWVAQAFNAWALYSKLKFKRVYDSSADIIIAFGSYYHGDRYPFDGPGNILAHAFYPYEENSFGGDIHFDNEENWKENATTMSEGVDFLTVLVHELGHSLGLAHSPVYSSLMFPYYKGLTQAQLDYDDILAMYSLYIMRTLKENGDEEGEAATDVTKSPQSSDESQESTTIKREENKIPTDEEKVDDRGDHDDNETTEPEAVPDICEGSFDAVSYLSGNIYVFKESFVWQFNPNFELNDDFPKKISKVFPNLPKRFKKIDAVYQVPHEDEIVIFSGFEYITYDIRGPIYTAYNITRYTYDDEIEKIDAAMVWAKNEKTYLFSADRYWKYSDNRVMNQFYPRVMTRWGGVPENLDAAISIPDGKTVFFKQHQYWEFDNKKVRPRKGFPKSIDELFDYCSE